MADDVAVKVSNVSKTFILPHEKTTSVKSAFLNFYKRKKGYEKQQVLDNVSFEVKKGEFFGIVGRNGSGKSTLLKLISQIYTPDSGDIQVNGKLTPFIELGVGFNPELSGRENVFLNGALLGFNRKEMEAMYDEIVAFAELERFMDQKLKNYSSGMQVRLAFSIAIRANTDILVLDEVLAVGDEAFQRKCYEYFAKLKRNKKTVILVTHSMEAVQKFCNKAMLIEKGSIIDSGNPSIVAEHYTSLFINRNINGKNVVAHNDAFSIGADLVRSKNNKKLQFSISLIPKKDFPDPVLGVYIRKDTGEIVWRWASDDKTETNKHIKVSIKKGKTICLILELDNILPSASFTTTILVRKSDKSKEYARYVDIIKFDNYKDSVYEKFWKMNEKVEVSYK